MLIDYNVSDHWSPNDPDWLKSLTSSLDRRHGTSATLPLTVIVTEIVDWVQLAGVDAWARKDNRESFRRDLQESTRAIGSSLQTRITAPLRAFETAFTSLIQRSNPALKQPPGTRTDAAWTAVSRAASELLAAVTSDEAVQANWDDLVATARNRACSTRKYRPIAELLFQQIQGRGHDADRIFRDLVSIVAFGRDPEDVPLGAKGTPIDERLESARIYVGTRPDEEPTVVWLGYKGRIRKNIEAGHICFYDARWTVPNAAPDRLGTFAHKSELWELVQDGYTFRVPELIAEEPEADTLVRVDLGTTTVAGVVQRATARVDVILNMSVHWGGGIRPRLTQYEVLRDGRPTLSGGPGSRTETGFPDDAYGAGITTDAIEQHGRRIAEAMAREELPLFLRAAVEVQTTLDHPFSRDMALRTPSEADIRSVVPLADRVVQHVAAHAAMQPEGLFKLLRQRWAHARWLNDLSRAASMCLLGGNVRRELRDELISKWMSEHLDTPRLLFLADRADDFLSLCRLEHERAWIVRMLSSIGDHAAYRSLTDEYEEEGLLLDGRRQRVRNALVHGNPTSFNVVQSAREYAEFAGNTALYLAIESYVQGTPVAATLEQRSDEFLAMNEGVDAEAYWRERVAKFGWPIPE